MGRGQLYEVQQGQKPGPELGSHIHMYISKACYPFVILRDNKMSNSFGNFKNIQSHNKYTVLKS